MVFEQSGRCLKSVRDLEEERIIWQAIGAVIARKFIIALEPEGVGHVVNCADGASTLPRAQPIVNRIIAAH